ncbi:hypothetical protein Y032_0030g2170 [Ancylostoma ceylanicum]|uniref:Uncharacterized protein n=1 Tax=Ancylostoma ceylanicum TaxID=53326 RepID=A0A016UR14_9BILA|nr:hypothetical protein Y032_0030g2170 [Ancylostoma ceylanicum]
MKCIFTEDEKWCMYVNIKRSPPWVGKAEQHMLQPKAGLHPLKGMVSSWCDCKGIVHCKVLPRYSALTVDLYWGSPQFRTGLVLHQKITSFS